MLRLLVLSFLALPALAADSKTPFGFVVEESPGVGTTLPSGTQLLPLFRAGPAHYVAYASSYIFCIELSPSGWPLTTTDFDFATKMSFGPRLYLVDQNPAFRLTPVTCGQPVGTPIHVSATPDVFVTGEPISGITTAPDGSVIAGTRRNLIRINPSTGAASIIQTTDDLANWLLDAEQRRLLASGVYEFEHPSVLVTPSGALWTHTRLFKTGADRVTVKEWVLRRDPNGTRTISVAEDASNPLLLVSAGARDPLMFYSSQLDAVVLSTLVLPKRLNGTGAWAGLASDRAPFHYFRMPMELLDGSTDGLGTLIGSAEGTLETTVRSLLRPVRFDPDVLDVDGDRLTRSEELALGSSDFNRDSDGDGITDHLEVRFFQTGLLDSGSRPTLEVPRQHYALSSKLQEWAFFTEGGLARTPATTGSSFCQGFEPIGCSLLGCSGFKQYRCRDHDGGWVSAEPIPGLPVTTTGGDTWWTVLDAGLSFASRANETLSPLPYSGGAVASLSLGGPGWGVVTQPRGVVRVTADAGSFPLYEHTRACQLLGRPADEPSCTRGEFSVPQLVTATAIGRDEARGLVFVEVLSQYARPIYAVTDTGATFVFDSLWVGDNTIGGLERARYEQAYFTHTGRTLDFAFRATARRAPVMAAFSPWFRDGFHTVEPSLFRVPAEPPARGCVSYKGIFVCDSSSIDTTTQPIIGIHNQAQWVPLDDDALRPGDVLFWSNSAHLSSTATEVARPALWRYSEAGGTEIWMRDADFRAIADPGALAALNTKGLDGVSQLSFSPDGQRLCLADALERLWVMSLEEGRPTSLSLERASGVRACLYDARGELAVLTATALELPGAPAVTTGLTQGVSLARAANTWIIQAVGEPSACVTGGVVRRGPALSALFAADDLVYSIDADGLATAAPADTFCAGGFTEWLSEYEDLWLATFNPLNTKYRVEVPRGTLLRRPDGELLYGSLGALRLTRGGAFKDPNAMNNFLWRYRPTYVPRSPLLGLERHEGWRRNTGKRTLVHPEVKWVSAMTVFPGALPPNWGTRVDVEFLGLTPRPYVEPIPEADAGVEETPDAGQPLSPEEPLPRGCGCQAVDAPVALGALGALVLRRRRGRCAQ